MTEQHVYVIGEPGSRIVKIGTTVDVARRLREIQYMSPVRLELLWSRPGDAALESRLHLDFARQRSHGEWFRFEESDDPVAVISAAAEAYATNSVTKEEALEQLDELTAAFTAAKAERDQARQELNEAIARHLRERNARPGEVADHTPYDRVHVGRIAKSAGVPPLRVATVRSVHEG